MHLNVKHSSFVNISIDHSNRQNCGVELMFIARRELETRYEFSNISQYYHPPKYIDIPHTEDIPPYASSLSLFRADVNIFSYFILFMSLFGFRKYQVVDIFLSLALCKITFCLFEAKNRRTRTNIPSIEKQTLISTAVYRLEG